jgi:anti-sigma factor RsiW
MTPQRVSDLIAAYGAAPEKWPQAERAEALAVLERTPALRAELAQMAALDAALNRWPAPALQLDAVALSAYVSATPRPRAAARRPLFRLPSFLAWPNTAGLAAAALAGFLVGWSGLDTEFGVTQTDSIDQQVVASLVEDATW